ncbi:putative deoxyribonuclease TATDN2 [Hydra vulgaris]|uniref:Putative deoxyribonuclease TATDN2 n=1 Tax=Hydra vulgaris TaxID=6087 RepID=T2M8B1_HYDVU|nr:putative deoxyribonuclease TATDN2 [Hydra vulgaris]
MASMHSACSQCQSQNHEIQDCPFFKVTSKFANSDNESKKNKSNYDIPIYDTHCHIDYVFKRLKHHNLCFKDFKESHFFPSNFKGCIGSFSDVSVYNNCSAWLDLLCQDGIWGSFGLHPHQAKYFTDHIYETMLQCLKHPKAVAVGECGLDLSRSNPLSTYSDQKSVFIKQLQIAKQTNKPIVVHSRDAEDHVYQILCDEDMREWPIHIHCFTGNCSHLHRFVNEFPNMFFGFTNLISYSTAKVTHEVVKCVPLDRILLETDAPYFVPKKLKNKCRFSHPGNVLFVAEEIALIKNKDIHIILDNCLRNVEKLFKI